LSAAWIAGTRDKASRAAAPLNFNLFMLSLLFDFADL
jgi:hypothetical protein